MCSSYQRCRTRAMIAATRGSAKMSALRIPMTAARSSWSVIMPSLAPAPHRPRPSAASPAARPIAGDYPTCRMPIGPGWPTGRMPPGCCCTLAHVHATGMVEMREISASGRATSPKIRTDSVSPSHGWEDDNPPTVTVDALLRTPPVPGVLTMAPSANKSIPPLLPLHRYAYAPHVLSATVYVVVTRRGLTPSRSRDEPRRSVITDVSDIIAWASPGLVAADRHRTRMVNGPSLSLARYFARGNDTALPAETNPVHACPYCPATTVTPDATVGTIAPCRSRDPSGRSKSVGTAITRPHPRPRRRRSTSTQGRPGR